MAVQGHPRSLISVPIENAYATSYWSLVLSCPVSEILQVFCSEQRHRPFPSEFWGVPLGLDSDVVSLRCEGPKLTIRVINFEVVQPICPPYLNATDRQTVGRTDDLG